jgi:hypothetical protein
MKVVASLLGLFDPEEGGGGKPVFRLVSWSVYPTLKMETVCSSEMLIDSQWTTQCYFPEGSTL